MAGTTILMSAWSSQPIEEIAVGDSIPSRVRHPGGKLVPRRVLRTHSQIAARTIELYLSTGNILEVSPGQKVMTSNGLRKASAITLGTKLGTTSGKCLTVIGVRLVAQPRIVH